MISLLNFFFSQLESLEDGGNDDWVSFVYALRILYYFAREYLLLCLLLYDFGSCFWHVSALA